MNRLYYIIYQDRAENSSILPHDIHLEKLEDYQIAEYYISKFYQNLNDYNILHVPFSIEPILITNDARLFLKYRNVFTHREFYQYCVYSDKPINEDLPFNFKHLAVSCRLGGELGLSTIKHFENIIEGNYNSVYTYVKYDTWTNEENGNTYSYEDEKGWKTSLDMVQNKILNQEFIFHKEEYNEDDIKPTEYHFHWWKNLDQNWKKIFSSKVQNGIICGIPTNEALSKVLSLKEIDIEYVAWHQHIQKIQSLEPLKALINLEILKGRSNNIDDISPLQNLKKLKFIDCSNNAVKSLLPLHDLQDLEELDISSNKVTSIENYLGLQSLKKIILNSNEIKELSSISKMTTLEHLEIKHNRITDISPLVNLKHLRVLNISNNSISSLEPLIKLTSLETLIFDNNKIQDLEPFRKLRYIEKLSFENNDISDLGPLSGFKNLKSVSCGKNKISYAEALGYSSRQRFTLNYW